MRRIPSLSLILLCLAMPAGAQQATDAVPPEMTTDLSADIADPALRASQEAKREGTSVFAANWMISAAHPEAVKAGAETIVAFDLRDGAENMRIKADDEARVAIEKILG